MKDLLASVVCCFVCAAAAWPQHKRPDQPATTTVSGHVYCADTNAPARMATVILQPADAVDAITPGTEKGVHTQGEAVETLLDGSFTLHHVPPGTYYVVASQAGYVSLLAPFYTGKKDEPATEGGEKRAPISAPRITVQANLPVAVNVTIERGAAVSGTVSFDDGSPASGVYLTLLVHWKDKWITVPPNPVGRTSFQGGTDDEGHYRISGLPAGEYALRAELNLTKTTYQSGDKGSSVSMTNVYSLSIYSGGGTRTKDAVPFSITTGEERRGVDMEIPLTKLHTIRGNIVSAHDGHILNGGMLSLLYPDDRSLAGRTNLSTDEDTFSFGFVPEGDYILHIDEASDNEYREVRNTTDSWPPTRTETRVLRKYGQADQPIHVAGDLGGVTVAAPDLPPQKPQPSQ